MNTEPVNPFQSPQAVDAPRQIVNHWRPTWRAVMLGLAILPFLWAALLSADLSIHNYLMGASATVPTREVVRYLYTSASLTFFLGAPLCSFAWKRFTLTPRGVLNLGGFIVLALGSIALTWFLVEVLDPSVEFPRQWSDRQNLIELIHVVEGLFVLVFFPFGLFALYLAYLRRRDQNRGDEPRG
jgi:hypothetical protein